MTSIEDYNRVHYNGVWLRSNLLYYRLIEFVLSEDSIKIDEQKLDTYRYEVSIYKRMMKTFCEEENIDSGAFICESLNRIERVEEGNFFDRLHNTMASVSYYSLVEKTHYLLDIGKLVSFEKMIFAFLLLTKSEEVDRLKTYAKFFESDEYAYLLEDVLLQIINEADINRGLSSNQLNELRLVLELHDGETLNENRKHIVFILGTALQNILPNFYLMVRSKIIFEDMFLKLHNISPGHDNWKEYEDCCEEILRFCFTPTHSKVFAQVISEDGAERRDFIIPNEAYHGVWRSLFYHYDCKNIIIEVKNKDSKFSNSIIHQISSYLMKSSIGRFGVLILRDKRLAEKFRKNIRSAYANKNILILMLDDSDIVDMMIYKVIYGNIDKYIFNQKVNFEINY